MSIFVFVDDVILVQLPENDENFHTNLKMEVSITSVVLHESFYNSPRKLYIITESEYIIKFQKYLAEVVNVDPFDDATNPKLGKSDQIYISSINCVRNPHKALSPKVVRQYPPTTGFC